MTMKLGTVLPDPAKMAVADRIADQQKNRDYDTGMKKFAAWRHQIVGGEHRWYRDDRYYSIVSQGRVKSFEIRNGEDYAV